MNLERIAASRRILATRTTSALATPVHELPPPRAVSRRQFVRSSAGAVVAGAALGSGILRPSVAHAFENADPVPIPGGTPLLGGGYHVWAPGGDPIDAEPITITDFNGFVGLAYISGMVTRRNRKTNAVDILPFNGADMRFMQGVYRGQDGRVRRGAFGLI
jgi:hypothetical protein